MKESTTWALGGPGVLVEYRPEVNGYVLVDVVDHRWPDRMGDPETEPEVFGAWSMGHFGPGTWPGSLARACEHSWGWPDGRTVPLQHARFIRIRISYVFGKSDFFGTPDLVKPEGYDPLHELEFVTRIAAALVRLPQALCYFNPNGECVRDVTQFLDCLSNHASAGQMPLYVWSNVRLFTLQNAEPDWNLMDTVGMSQLDAADHEALFESTAYETGDVDGFLRTMSSYVVTKGPIIRHGDTADGPGNVRWQGFRVEKANTAPPRPVIRWFPLDRRKIPTELAKGPLPQLT
jgi:hypothetical protein